MEPLHIGTIFHILLALFHLSFWKLFHWDTQLAKLSFINRNVMQILNTRITYLFALFAYISWEYSFELRTTSLGRAVVKGLALFWYMRAAEQLYFFGVSNLYSNLILGVFVLGGAIYSIPLL